MRVEPQQPLEEEYRGGGRVEGRDTERDIDVAVRQVLGKRIDVAKDGNCQFLSLTYGMSRWNAHSLRMATVAELGARQHLYMPYLDETSTERWKVYMETMASPGEYGDHITLQAAAQVLDADIWLLDGRHPTILRKVAQGKGDRKSVV